MGGTTPTSSWTSPMRRWTSAPEDPDEADVMSGVDED
jgi:hypothetical protein